MRRFYSICIFILGAALAFAKPQIQSSCPDLQKVFDGIKLVDGVWTAVIPDGKYRIAKDAEGNAIRIHGQENIAIIGSKNVEIIGANPSRDFIEIRNSKNILIKGFCVDLDPLPFLQGEIIDVIPEKSAIRVKIPPELLNPDSPTFDFIREKHPGNVSIYPKGETFSYIANPGRPIFKGSEKAGDDTWDIELTFIEERFMGGTLLMYGWFNGWLSSIMGSENIVLDGIRTYCVTGGNFFLMHNDGDITVRNCVVRPRDGTSYLWAADGGNRDGAYCNMDFQEYLRFVNHNRFVIAQIEDVEALEELDAICAVPGIDIIFFGPGDFSQSIGHPGEFDRPEIAAARRRVAEAALRAGKFAGTVGGPGNAAELIAEGVRFINLGSDVVGLGAYCRDLLAQTNSNLAKEQEGALL